MALMLRILWLYLISETAKVIVACIPPYLIAKLLPPFLLTLLQCMRLLNDLENQKKNKKNLKTQLNCQGSRTILYPELYQVIFIALLSREKCSAQTKFCSITFICFHNTPLIVVMAPADIEFEIQ